MTEFPFKLSEPLEERVAEGLVKISLVLRSRSWRGSALESGTPTQDQILTILQARSQSDARLSDITKELAVSTATASAAVTTLVEKGVVH